MAENEKDAIGAIVTQQFLRDQIEFVGGAGAVIEKLAAAEKAFGEKVKPTVEKLAEKGVLTRESIDRITTKWTENPGDVLDACVKLADAIHTPTMGRPSSESIDKSAQATIGPNGRPHTDADRAFEDRIRG